MSFELGLVVVEVDEVWGAGVFAVGLDAEEGVGVLVNGGEDVGAEFDLGVGGEGGAGLVGEVPGV